MPINPNIPMSFEAPKINDPMEVEAKALQLNAANQKRVTDFAKQQAWAVQDEASYQAARKAMLDNGMPNADKLPEFYEPNFVKRWQIATLDGEKQAELGLKQMESAAKLQQEQVNSGFREREVSAKELEASAAAQAAGIKATKEKNDEAFKKSPQGKLAGLNTSDKGRFDNAKLGLQEIQNMDAALVGGDNTFSLIGDNDYTRSLRMAAETFGRMQSGGAINKDEEKRFLAMAPKPTDSKEQQRKKLEQMQRIYSDRLNTLGFTPEEAGVEFKPIAYGNFSPNKSGFGIDAANASAPPPIVQQLEQLPEEKLRLEYEKMMMERKRNATTK